MKIYPASIALAFSFSALSLSGCMNVEPWDREFLAKDYMAPDPSPLNVSFMEHANFSREGTYGALSPDVGGCGCN